MTPPHPSPPSERIITLHPHEVRAYLAGTLTQLRRPVKKQPEAGRCDGVWTLRTGRGKWTTNERLVNVFGNDGTLLSSTTSLIPVDEWLLEYCPYKPGDVLLGKEPHYMHSCPHGNKTCIYVEDYDDPNRILNRSRCRRMPASRMKHIDCRIRPMIKSVRVEQVQRISEADAIACFTTPSTAPAHGSATTGRGY